MLSTDDLKDENIFVWKDRAGKIMICRIAPNKMLLRKCKKPDTSFIIGEAKESSRIADGIMQDMTERPGMINADGWCEVLAVGDKREYTEMEKDKYDIPKGFSSPVKKGDLVCIPESSKHGRHWRCGVTGLDYDVVVAEYEPFLYAPSKG
jgi:hypothetical protein